MPHHRRFITSCAVAALVVLQGCGKSATEEIAAARMHLASGDLTTATIELKNALQKEPGSAEARLLLGRALYQSGSIQAAQIELDKALTAGAPADDVVPLLARVQLALGAHDKVTRDLATRPLTRPDAVADLQTSVGQAWLAQKRLDSAAAATRKALEAQPDFAPAHLLQARLAAAEGRFDDALRTVDAVLKREPKQVDASLLKGHLLTYGKNDIAAGTVVLEAGLAQQPDSVLLASALIENLLRQGRPDDARRRFEGLRKTHPTDLQTRFFEALFAIQSGDAKQARASLQSLMKIAPDNPRLLLMAGYEELRSGSPVQAEAHLGKAVQLIPEAAAPRRMLAEVYLRTGQPGKATEVLEPVVSAEQPDAQALYTAAIAAMQSGDLARAEAAFDRAARAAPDDARIQTARAMAKLSGGNAQGLTALEALASRDGGSEAEMALVAVHLQRRDFAKALVAVDRLARKVPDSPLADDLRARVLLAQGDEQGARQSLDKALARQPAYAPALSQQVALDMKANQPDAARKRLEAARKADPTRVEPLLALAALDAQVKRPREEVLARFAEAQKVAPENTEVRRAHVQYLLSEGQNKQALEAAQATAAALPDRVEVLEVLGIAQAVDGQLQVAAATFGKLATLSPGQPIPLLRLADVQMKQGDLDAASKSIGRASELSPRSPLLHAAVVALGRQPQGHERALSIAKTLQRDHAMAGHALEGDLRMLKKDWGGARAAFQQAVKHAGDEPGNLPVSLFQTWVAEGKTDEAERFGRDWLRTHPKDVALRLHLGAFAMERKSHEQAAGWYRQVLELSPRNALALNNLAWVLAEQGSKESVEVAKRAQALAPRSAEVLDTLAHAYDKTGQLQEALRTQQAAVDMAPGSTRLRLALARLQLKAGDKSAAKASLEAVISASPPRPVVDDAKKLLATI